MNVCAGECFAFYSFHFPTNDGEFAAAAVHQQCGEITPTHPQGCQFGWNRGEGQVGWERKLKGDGRRVELSCDLVMRCTITALHNVKEAITSSRLHDCHANMA